MTAAGIQESARLGGSGHVGADRREQLHERQLGAPAQRRRIPRVVEDAIEESGAEDAGLLCGRRERRRRGRRAERLPVVAFVDRDDQRTRTGIEPERHPVVQVLANREARNAGVVDAQPRLAREQRPPGLRVGHHRAFGERISRDDHVVATLARRIAQAAVVGAEHHGQRRMTRHVVAGTTGPGPADPRAAPPSGNSARASSRCRRGARAARDPARSSRPARSDSAAQC